MTDFIPVGLGYDPAGQVSGLREPGAGDLLPEYILNIPNSTAKWNASSLQGYAVATTSPTLNYILKWNGTAWVPSPVGTSNSDAAYLLGIPICTAASDVSAGQALVFSQVANAWCPSTIVFPSTGGAGGGVSGTGVSGNIVKWGSTGYIEDTGFKITVPTVDGRILEWDSATTGIVDSGYSRSDAAWNASKIDSRSVAFPGFISPSAVITWDGTLNTWRSRSVSSILNDTGYLNTQNVIQTVEALSSYTPGDLVTWGNNGIVGEASSQYNINDSVFNAAKLRDISLSSVLDPTSGQVLMFSGTYPTGRIIFSSISGGGGGGGTADYATLAGSATSAYQATSATTSYFATSATSALNARQAPAGFDVTGTLKSPTLSGTNLYADSAVIKNTIEIASGVYSAPTDSRLYVQGKSYFQNQVTVNSNMSVTGSVSAATVSATNYLNLPSSTIVWASAGYAALAGSATTSYQSTSATSALYAILAPSGFSVTGTLFTSTVSATNYLNVRPHVSSVNSAATTSLTMGGDYNLYLVDTTTTGVTLYLPDASAWTHKQITISKIDNGGSYRAVTVSGTTLQTATNTVLLYDPTESITVVSNGTNWYSLDYDRAYGVVFVAKNSTGATLTKGTPVKVVGATGNNVLVAATSAANNHIPAAPTGALSRCIGVVEHDIPTGEFGHILTKGTLYKFNTAAYAEGDQLYLGSSGGFTNVKPTPPYESEFLGIVTRTQSQNGSILIDVANPIHINDIVGFNLASSLINGDLISYSTATSTFTNVQSVSISGHGYFGSVSATNYLNLPSSTIVWASAGYASLAGSSTLALNATSATTALNATSATLALNATSATLALNATSATTALNATSATLALNATSATTALNANKLQGYDVSSVAPSNNQVLSYNTTVNAWVPTTNTSTGISQAAAMTIVGFGGF
jgi:hypothetical protein